MHSPLPPPIGAPRAPVRTRRRRRRGATAIEYGLIVSVMTIAILGGLYHLYLAVQAMWNAVAAAMP